MLFKFSLFVRPFLTSCFHILGKCRIHDCGKGHCKVNETHPEPTCICDEGYQLNKNNRCEDCEFQHVLYKTFLIICEIQFLCRPISPNYQSVLADRL